MVTSQVRVRPCVKIVTFRITDYRDGTNNSYVPKFCQNASQEMNKM